jgi:deoxyribose-phosphate aldolase
MSPINSIIDHTLLRPDATTNDIKALCQEAIDNKFHSICVTPHWVGFVSSLLEKSDTEVSLATVIDFPHGNLSFNAKTEIVSIYNVFVDEFDVVANISAIKSGDWLKVEQEVKAIRNETGNTIKYIVEVGYLTDVELFKIADILIRQKIDFIKTCTGYGPRNVTVEDISKIKNHVRDSIEIKASGGIKTYEFAKQLVDAGANRLGTSNSINIIKGASANAGEIPILGGY